MILADYRMPQMNGIEFLEEAIGVYPGARRVLLTAYADTGAAIDAINVVDLDHYLLKPWDPPEEKLYPVVDDLLTAWRSSDFRPVPATKVVGHRWSAPSSRVREFLARNQVPYRWYSSDEPEGSRLLEAAGADGRRLPLVLTPDGTVLTEPEPADLAAHVGLATAPSAEFYDLVVIGGGPAGLGAAVYGASEGLRTVLVERSATGGQAGQSPGSRTTSASPTVSPVPSSRTVPDVRRPVSERRSSRRVRSPVSRPTAPPVWCASPTARPSPRTASSWRPGCPTGSSGRRAATT